MWAVWPMLWTRTMKNWKALLGVGAACAACCAIPLIGAGTALAAGSSALFAGGLSALMACADEFLPVATLAAVALGLVGFAGRRVWSWRRRRASPVAGTCGCTPAAASAATSSNRGTGQSNANL
jgi:hypothetical protein